jgi:hypothetical protein
MIYFGSRSSSTNFSWYALDKATNSTGSKIIAAGQVVLKEGYGDLSERRQPSDKPTRKSNEGCCSLITAASVSWSCIQSTMLSASECFRTVAMLFLC